MNYQLSQLIMMQKVTAIVDGKEHVESYDKLIWATGSQPILASD